MANTWADGDLQVSANEKLAAELKLAVAERNIPPNHPVLQAGYLGEVQGTGAQTITQKLWDLGSGTAAQRSETGDTPIEDLSYSDFSATVVPHRKGRAASDFVDFLDPTNGGTIRNPQAMAVDMLGVYYNTLLQKIADVAPSFTRSKGTSGAAMTWATLVSAKNTLSLGNVQFAPGQLLYICPELHWQQLESDLSADATKSDAQTHTPEAYAIQVAQSAGYRGTYFGISIFTTNRCPTSGGGLVGQLLAPLGICWADGVQKRSPHGFQDMYLGGKLMVEYQREAGRGIENMYYSFPLGVNKGDDLRGIKLIGPTS